MATKMPNPWNDVNTYRVARVEPRRFELSPELDAAMFDAICELPLFIRAPSDGFLDAVAERNQALRVQPHAMAAERRLTPQLPRRSAVPPRKHISNKTCGGKDAFCLAGKGGACVACSDDD